MAVKKIKTMCVCDNCEHACDESKLINPIPDLEQRIEPGGEVPAGECPKCGALSYVNRTTRRTLKQACRVALDAMRQLADQAGDVPEWNKGGFAHEACNVLRNALAK